VTGTRRRRRADTTPALRFDERLVLNQYILNLFEADKFDDLSKDMKDTSLEGWDENNTSYFYKQLVDSRLFERSQLDRDLLLQYDRNIYHHTQAINGRRSEEIKWKYFQYFSLLFTEIYLDRYFSNHDKLLEDLNSHVDAFNEDKADSDKIDLYEKDELRRLAFWNATGSGKTLLMHINILQYQHYLESHRRAGELNRVILLTPNEGLSLQHLQEFRLSGIAARLFDKDASLSNSAVYQPAMWDKGTSYSQGQMFGASKKLIIEIIDIHKLKEDSGQKTVAVDAFEGKNLVLVDEGHRGSSGVDWKSRRDRLCENGFSFEYSATFGQAMKAANKRSLTQEYARCILFDYSYKRFFKDGYGKMYNILNLSEEMHLEQRNLYLTACLLSFYQQQLIYRDNESKMIPFNLENPLWIFVGSKVNAVRTENRRKVSDVVDILLFLRDFVADKDKSIENLDLLLQGRSELRDGSGQDVFENEFTYLIKQMRTGENLLKHILELLFNNANPGAMLHIDNLKGVEGEIALRLGDGDYFGVINVGDDRSLLKLCEENGLAVSEREFSSSLFSSINERDSKVNLLIGSKKFSEGWNSWRVSTMGLMNIGRKEGSEIIQLFGRGVRLKGYRMSLKRSTALDDPDLEIPQNLSELETLNVFGVRADYMKQFKEYLEEEGLPADKKPVRIDIAVIPTIPEKSRLKVLKVKDNVNFKKDAPRPTLSLPNQYIYRNPVVVNWYPRIQLIATEKAETGSAGRFELHSFEEKHLAFMNFEEIYFHLHRYKDEQRWYNLNLNKEILYKLLLDKDWYRLYIPGHELDFNDFSKVFMWQEIAVALLKKYCERFYLGNKAEYESDKMEYISVQDYEAQKVKEGKHGNIPGEYIFSVLPEAESFIAHLQNLKDEMDRGEFKDDKIFNGCEVFKVDNHLYQPLIYLKNSQVKVSPVHLNEGERDLVIDIQAYYKKNDEYFKNKEIFLLRNQSRGSGIGFFEAGNFYPDFILWLIDEGKQYISFIDPKGLRNIEAWEDPKIRFCETIKEKEAKLGDANVILDSFIISVTPYAKLNWKGDNPKAEFERHHILFQEDRNEYVAKIFSMIK
jgi:hypothetical protein